MISLLRRLVSARSGPRSNVPCWQQMQEAGYFENCPDYKGLPDLGDVDIRAIEQFRPLTPDMTVVVIGCGYGRESVHICPRVKHVYGIDVSDRILSKAKAHLRDRGIANFTPVLAEHYKEKIPSGIDLIFSIV